MAANWLAQIPAQKFPSDADPFCTGCSLKLSPREPGAVDRGRQPSPIAAAEDRRIQNVDRFVVETFEDRAGKVRLGSMIRRPAPAQRGLAPAARTIIAPF